MLSRVSVFASGLAVCLVVISGSCYAQSFVAMANAGAVACSPATGETNGGPGEVFATAAAATSGDCGDTGSAQASSFASADLATGVAYATAQGSGLVTAHRADSTSDFRDRLAIVAPAGVDAVAIEATVTFIVNTDVAFPQSANRLIANVGVAPNEIDLFLCNPALCPNDPLESVEVTEVFIAERNANGSFFDVTVNALATADMIDGAAEVSASITVRVADDSGAVLVSDSGVFGSGAVDGDSDGIADTVDNCSTVANPDQRDTNADGFGNLCDPDLNNDLTVNVVDLGLLRTVFFSDDPDADFNGDGVVNVSDLGILRSFFFGPPGPGAVTRR